MATNEAPKKRKPRKIVFVQQAIVEALINGLSPKVKIRVLANLLTALESASRKYLVKKVANGDAVVHYPRGRKSGLENFSNEALARELLKRSKKRGKKKKN